jgi:hypothetical protein
MIPVRCLLSNDRYIGGKQKLPEGTGSGSSPECRVEPADAARTQKLLHNFQRVRLPGSTQAT